MELIKQLRRGLVDLYIKVGLSEQLGCSLVELHKVVGLSELLSSRLVALPLLCAVVKPVVLLSVL